MIDPKDALLLENLQNVLVELTGGIEIAPERFLNDDANPAIGTVIKTACSQSFDDRVGLRGRRGKIEQTVRAGTAFSHLTQTVSQLVVELRIIDVSSEIVE